MIIRRVALVVVTIAVALEAHGGIGPARAIIGGADYTPYATAFDGRSYVLAYIGPSELLLQRIDENGDTVGSAVPLTNERPSNVAVASDGRGLSLVVWAIEKTGGASTLHGAWVDSTGSIVAVARLGDAVRQPVYPLRVIAVNGRFAIAWGEQNTTTETVKLSLVEPRATSSTSTTVVANHARFNDMAAAGSHAVLRWFTKEYSICTVGEDCYASISHVSVVDEAGNIVSSGESENQTGTPLPRLSADVAVLNDAIVRVGGARPEVWEVSGAKSIAVRDGLLYAIRAIYQAYLFGGVTPSTPLEGEYRLSETATLTGGVDTMLLVSGAPDQHYRIIDFTTPFPPLPPPVASITATLAPYLKDQQGETYAWSGEMQWPPVAGAERSVIEAVPLSDPTALGGVQTDAPASVGTMRIPLLEADVRYALRVYSENAVGLSKPAEYIVKTPAYYSPRAPISVTFSAAADFATFTWRNPSTNASGFDVKACGCGRDVCGIFNYTCRIIASTGPDATALTVPLLPGNYRYVLAAFTSTSPLCCRVHADALRNIWVFRPARRRAVH